MSTLEFLLFSTLHASWTYWLGWYARPPGGVIRSNGGGLGANLECKASQFIWFANTPYCGMMIMFFLSSLDALQVVSHVTDVFSGCAVGFLKRGVFAIGCFVHTSLDGNSLGRYPQYPLSLYLNPTRWFVWFLWCKRASEYWSLSCCNRG